MRGSVHLTLCFKAAGRLCDPTKTCSCWIRGSRAPQLVLVFHTPRLHPLLHKAVTEVSSLKRTPSTSHRTASVISELRRPVSWRLRRLGPTDPRPSTCPKRSHRPRAAFPSCSRFSDLLSQLSGFRQDDRRGLGWKVRSPGRSFLECRETGG